MRKAPTLRNNNGALQVRVRLDGKDYFINRLGRWDDPVARARALSISAEIWSDYQQGDLDLTLNRYRLLVDGKDLDLLDGLKELMERTHLCLSDCLEVWNSPEDHSELSTFGLIQQESFLKDVYQVDDSV